MCRMSFKQVLFLREEVPVIFLHLYESFDMHIAEKAIDHRNGFSLNFTIATITCLPMQSPFTKHFLPLFDKHTIHFPATHSKQCSILLSSQGLDLATRNQSCFGGPFMSPPLFSYGAATISRQCECCCEFSKMLQGMIWAKESESSKKETVGLI